MLKLKLQYYGDLTWRVESLEKTLMLGKIEGRKRRGWEDEMVGWHHWLNGHEFEQALRAGDRQVSLACCSLWGRKELHMTEQLNWTELNSLFGTFINSRCQCLTLHLAFTSSKLPNMTSKMSLGIAECFLSLGVQNSALLRIITLEYFENKCCESSSLALSQNCFGYSNSFIFSYAF